MRNLIFTVMFITLILINSVSAEELTPSRFQFGIEFGGGHNTLSLSGLMSIWGDGSENYTDMYITPNIRFNYRITVLRHFYLQPFLGYHAFGGCNNEASYRIFASEYGLIMQYQYSRIALGVGIKQNSILKADYINENSVTETNTLDQTDWFDKHSNDAGIKLSYLFNKYIVSTEAWFGLDNISTSDDLEKFRQNHYRVLIGYYF